MLYLNEVGHWPKQGYRLLSEMEILFYILAGVGKVIFLEVSF
jgi:hypothetical protein